MKKLANTSPFLLLLAPVFVFMMIAFASNTTNDREQEVVVNNTKTTGFMIESVIRFLK